MTARPRIVLLVGLPGSGKSTWLKGKEGVLSTDALRELLLDDPNNQHHNRFVFRVLRDLLKQRLEIARGVTYVDATNLTPYERRPYIMLADLWDAEIEAVFFDVPLAECIRRNRARGRVVPEDVIHKMAGRLVAPDLEEGFSNITVIR
jgi:predicted kinase